MRRYGTGTTRTPRNRRAEKLVAWSENMIDVEFIDLRNGATGQRAIDVLRDQAGRAGNLPSRTHGLSDAQGLDLYLTWAQDTERMLGNVLGDDAVDGLVHSDAYWSLRTGS